MTIIFQINKRKKIEVWEKINYLLEEKNIRLFIGKREIKIELIPYIAEVLGVSEQELFSGELEYATNQNVKYSKEVREMISLIPYAPHAFIEQTLETLRKYKKLLTESQKI